MVRLSIYMEIVKRGYLVLSISSSNRIYFQVKVYKNESIYSLKIPQK